MNGMKITIYTIELVNSCETMRDAWRNIIERCNVIGKSIGKLKERFEQSRET